MLVIAVLIGAAALIVSMNSSAATNTNSSAFPSACRTPKVTIFDYHLKYRSWYPKVYRYYIIYQHKRWGIGARVYYAKPPTIPKELPQNRTVRRSTYPRDSWDIFPAVAVTPRDPIPSRFSDRVNERNSSHWLAKTTRVNKKADVVIARISDYYFKRPGYAFNGEEGRLTHNNPNHIQAQLVRPDYYARQMDVPMRYVFGIATNYAHDFVVNTGEKANDRWQRDNCQKRYNEIKNKNSKH